MTDPCDRCDGEGKDCVNCKHVREYLKEAEHNCYTCSRFSDCMTNTEYMFEIYDEWRKG